MQVQVDTRVKKRLPCNLNLETRQHTGMILNLSKRGIFVQTTLPVEPGTLVDIDFHDPAGNAPIVLQAAVVWRRRVSPRMTGVNQSGMGMRILTPPPAYAALVHGILPYADRAPDAALDFEPPQRELECYVVRLAKAGGPRSRRMELRCESEHAARSRALSEAGAGWTVLEITRRG